MNHTKTVCKPQSEPVVEKFSWVNQEVKQGPTEDKEHCVDRTKVNCEKRTVTKTIQKPVRKQRTVNDQQRRCRVVQNKQPDQTITIPVSRVVYNTMCYEVPR